MKTRLDHPEALNGFEAAPPRSLRRWTGFGLVVWLLLLVVDWTARVTMFRWQDQWLPSPPPKTSATEFGGEGTDRKVPAQMGAGLTQMVPVPWIAARYAEHHPGYAVPRDDFGYSNAPLPAGSRYRVVMLGDSFMLSLGTQNIAQVLASVGGVSVYNHAKRGAGPFLEMEKFIMSGRFDPPPRVVIWNLTARELGARLFLRQPVEAWFAKVDVWAAHRQAASQSRIRWQMLTSSALRKEWPNTSLMAYSGRRMWGQLKLLVFREWPRDVLGAEDPQFGPMLFYRENLRVLPLLKPGENAKSIVQVVSRVAAHFRERGEVLVVLLVPEKEQIHLRALPWSDQIALACGSELFAEIETGLEAAGTPVVNLMPVFQEATARGERLYWRDDTHWNDAGIRLAAEELWRVVEPALK